MGIGDEIMAAGRAEKLSKEHNLKVAICDRAWRPRYHEVWENNPYIVFEDTELKIQDCPGIRGYIDRWDRDNNGNPILVYKKDYINEEHPGSIFIDENLKEAAEILVDKKSIVVNPTVISPPSSNGKIWPRDRWEELSTRLYDLGYKVITIGQTDPGLPKTEWFETENIMEAAAVVSASSLIITSEGGIHHVAGATNTTAIVLFGSFVSPKTTGYGNHINLYIDDGHAPCGIFTGCDKCKKSMESITVDTIVSIVESEFAELRIKS